MRKVLLFLLGILLAALPLTAQNNPYSIDDECYALFQQAEDLVGKEEFDAVNEELLRVAREKGDTKSEVLYYVVRLKHVIRGKGKPGNDALVEAARQDLVRISKEKGYNQYYYYAYHLTTNYYYNSGQVLHAYDLLIQMQDTAIAEKDEYGLFSSWCYMVDLYIHLKDYMSAKTYIVRALDLYNSSKDETLRRQSPSRLYFDLADTYPVGHDSVRININRGVAACATHLDSLRSYYYISKLAIMDGDIPQYQLYKEKFLADPQRERMNFGDGFFRLTDAVLDGTIDQYHDEIRSLKRIRQYKLIANLCEEYGFKDFGFKLEKEFVADLEKTISRNNLSRLSELDVSMGKATLSADLKESQKEVTRIHNLLIILVFVIMAMGLVFALLSIRRLKKTNERVRLADEAKTRFVQNMSHEVRTPLNAIVGFSQLLSLPDGTLQPEEKDEFAGHIINNSKMLTMLLDDILNASAMDKGEYRIRYEEGELHYMCQAAISSTEHRLQPGVQLLYEPESPDPHSFFTDPRRLQQILINLLSNACKHTTQGSIVLRSSLTQEPGFVTFTVTDTGPGVPPEQAEAIFDRFTKLNEFVQGTGLGLSICREIATRMGGKVYLDTTYTDGGARFIFMVPDRQEMPANATVSQ